MLQVCCNIQTHSLASPQFWFPQPKIQSNLQAASIAAATMVSHIKQHKSIDFRLLQGFNPNPNWDVKTAVDKHRAQMMTVCAFRFDLDIPTVVCWIGGPHVAAHRDHARILCTLKPHVDADIHVDLTRIFYHGAPALCNAEASTANYHVYRAYGNHQYVLLNQAAKAKAMQKDSRRDFVLTMNSTLTDFIPNAHVTPMGIVNLDTKPRPVFDSSFRPYPWSSAINNWTDKSNEPALKFPTSFLSHLTFIMNMQISYPDKEIYNGDNDTQCAFQWIKYHAKCVAMHAYLAGDNYLCLATGQTFGDTTSPSNWELVPCARQQYAQYLWTLPNIVEIAKANYSLPNIAFAPPTNTS